MITEACPANMGVVPPVGRFNEMLAELCRENGALLIMDEVLTGSDHRVGLSGPRPRPPARTSPTR